MIREQIAAARAAAAVGVPDPLPSRTPSSDQLIRPTKEVR